MKVLSNIGISIAMFAVIFITDSGLANADDDCCLDCSKPCRCRGIVAGVEATYLKPNIGNGINFTNPIRSFNSYDYADLNSFEGAPRIWLGVENDATGWGIRARYWELDAVNQDGFTDVDAMFVESVDAGVYAEVNTIDLEMTRRLERLSRGNWSWLGSFGARHAALKRGESLDYLYVDAFGAALSSQTNSYFNFDGTGVTGSLEGRRPIGNRGFALACNLRGSVLWGTNNALATSLISDAGARAIQVVGCRENAEHYIFEVQAGLEWSRRIECLRGDVFSHLMFEYQRWSADQTPFDYTQTLVNTSITTVSGSSLSSVIDFTGLAFAIGFTR